MLTQPPSRAQTARQVTYVVVLAACGILSPLILGLGLLIRHRSANSWDYKERWSGVWAFAIFFGLIYGLIFWFARPFPFLLTAIWLGFHAHRLIDAAEWIAALWAYNGVLLSPAFALVCEALIPRTRRVQMRPRQSLPSVQQARAGEELLAQGFRQVGDDLLVGLPEQSGEHG